MQARTHAVRCRRVARKVRIKILSFPNLPSIRMLSTHQLCAVQVRDGEVRQRGLDLEGSHRSVDLLRVDSEVEDTRNAAGGFPDLQPEVGYRVAHV